LGNDDRTTGRRRQADSQSDNLNSSSVAGVDAFKKNMTEQNKRGSKMLDDGDAKASTGYKWSIINLEHAGTRIVSLGKTSVVYVDANQPLLFENNNIKLPVSHL
jgi:hypothetical protein